MYSVALIIDSVKLSIYKLTVSCHNYKWYFYQPSLSISEKILPLFTISVILNTISVTHNYLSRYSVFSTFYYYLLSYKFHSHCSIN